MFIDGYEIPEGYESMTCFHNCGFILVWAVGRSEGMGEKMDKHYETCPYRDRKYLYFRKGK